MRHIHGKLALASFLFVWGSLAAAADTERPYTIKDDTPPLGSMLKRGSVHGTLPYDKRYAELTPEQRAQVKADYEPMAENDEPPFPAEGLGPIMKAFHKAAQAFGPRGTLDAAVEIGPDGAARSLKLYKAPDDARFTQFATQLLMATPWKPALCGGQPCLMWYPVHVEFSVDNSR